MLIGNLDNPKISVIIPVNNQEKYVLTAINSVLAQSYRNLELVIVDDGSTDRTLELCREIETKEERIKVISQENLGQGIALETGVKACEGEYITFINGDDAVSPEMIITLVRGLQYATKVSACSFNFFKDDSQLVTLNNMDFAVNYQTMYLSSFSDVQNANLLIGKLFEKSLFEKIIFPNVFYHAEEFITYKLLDAAAKINYIAKPLYYVRNTEHSKSRILTPQKFQDLLNAYCGRIEFFEAKKNTEQMEKALNPLFDTYIRYYFSPLKSTKEITNKEFKRAKESIRAMCNKLESPANKKEWGIFKMKVLKYGFLDAGKE